MVLSDWTINEHWTNGECKMSALWTHDERTSVRALWTVSARTERNEERKWTHWAHGEGKEKLESWTLQVLWKFTFLHFTFNKLTQNLPPQTKGHIDFISLKQYINYSRKEKNNTNSTYAILDEERQIPKNLSEVDDDKQYFDYCLFDTFKVVSNNCINN